MAVADARFRNEKIGKHTDCSVAVNGNVSISRQHWVNDELTYVNRVGAMRAIWKTTVEIQVYLSAFKSLVQNSSGVGLGYFH